MTKILQLILFLFLLTFLSAPHAYARNKTLLLSTSEPASDVIIVYFDFLKLAYKNIGYDLKLVRLPGKRAFNSADQGKVDGLVLTTQRIMQTYPNIIAVDVPLTKVDLALYAVSDDLVIKDRQTLLQYRLGMLRGYPFTKKFTAGMDRQIVNSYESLFSILEIGRVDVAVAIRTEADRFLAANPKFNKVKLIKASIHSLCLYHFLNKKHQDIAVAVTPVIKKLLEEKELEKRYDAYTKESNKAFKNR